MRENRCASACPTVVLDLTCVRGTQGEREWGGACAGTQAVSLTCRSLHRQRELAVGYVCSGGLEDLRNGGGGWNLGTTSAAWLLPLGGAGAVVHTCRSLRELAAGFVRSTGRKERRRGLEPGDRRRRRGSCPWRR
jgi:hypothetical protein